jgi:hypothetical protein
MLGTAECQCPRRFRESSATSLYMLIEASHIFGRRRCGIESRDEKQVNIAAIITVWSEVSKFSVVEWQWPSGELV